MTKPPEESAHVPDAPAEDSGDRVPVTPGLVILGLLAVALGLFAAVVMSAHSLAR